MKAKLIVILFSIATLFACGRSNKEANGGYRSELAQSEASLKESIVANDMQTPPPPPPPSEDKSSIDKKIIKTAYLSMEVASYEKCRKLIEDIIKGQNAYIVNENLQNTDYQITNNINIKVPADKFEKLLAEIGKLAKKIEYQNIEMQDVTEEYIDVETRLSNNRKVEQTYLKLLRRTTSIEDILKIEQKLGEIRTEIESTEGRLKYLNQQVSLSTINLNVYQKLEYKYIPEKSEGFFQRLVKSLDLGWKGIITFLLFLIRLWPLWLIAAAGWYVWKHYFKSRKQRRAEEKKRKKMEKKQRKEQREQQEIAGN